MKGRRRIITNQRAGIQAYLQKWKMKLVEINVPKIAKDATPGFRTIWEVERKIPQKMHLKLRELDRNG